MKTTLIAGVDEAGRGPLAGPVTAAAVILNPLKRIRGLKDSKIILPKERERLFSLIQEKAIAWAIASASVEEIEKLNILHASMLAMERAIAMLSVVPNKVLVDGNRLPANLPCEGEAIIDGDALEPAISAASILAKVARDREMISLDVHYPHYGFKQHKGYATEAHLLALKKQGPCAIHRKKFLKIEIRRD